MALVRALVKSDDKLAREFQPPSVTSRGIQATLYVAPDQLDIGDAEPVYRQTVMLAWTYCIRISDRSLVCILFHLKGDGTVPVASRILSHAAVTVEEGLLSEFEPRELFLSDKPDIKDTGLFVAQSFWPGPKIKGIQVKCPDCDIELNNFFPRRPIRKSQHYPFADVQLGSHLLFSTFMYTMEINVLGFRLTVNNTPLPEFLTIMIWLSKSGNAIYCRGSRDAQSMHEFFFGSAVGKFGQIQKPLVEGKDWLPYEAEDNDAFTFRDSVSFQGGEGPFTVEL